MRRTNDYNSLPYNETLRERAKKLRRAGYMCEVLLWRQFHNRNFRNYDFDRQKIIGSYIVDFYCVDCRVVIEVDGQSHEQKVAYDRRRDAYLEGLGLTVIHIPALEVLYALDGVMKMLNEHPALRRPVEM